MMIFVEVMLLIFLSMNCKWTSSFITGFSVGGRGVTRLGRFVREIGDKFGFFRIGAGVTGSLGIGLIFVCWRRCSCLLRTF